MTKIKSLLDTFASLDQAAKDSLAEENSPLVLSLAALNIAATEAGVERLSVEHIVACLEAAGVAVSKASVSKALARAGGRISITKSPIADTVYKLMTTGKREIEARFGGELMSVVRIEGGQPRTARQRLGDMLAGLKGIVRICDPYYGVRTLDSLDHLPRDTVVRFLTAKTSESARTVQGAIRDFVKERPATEFRLVAQRGDLHDRYVLTSEHLLLLGHGLKDIGGKESFIVRIDKALAPDLLSELTSAFEARWQAGIAL